MGNDVCCDSSNQTYYDTRKMSQKLALKREERDNV